MFLLLAVIVACFVLYRWQTQEEQKPVVVVATPTPATPTPAPKKPEYRPDLSGRATPKSGTAPMTRSAEIQKELGLKGTSLDERPKK